MSNATGSISAISDTRTKRGGGHGAVHAWSDLSPTEKGQFRWVSIARLGVDEAYQRTQNKEKMRHIASKWSWAGCGVIIVSERADGDLMVLDGGHRVGAARIRGDIEELPCLIFQIPSVSEESKAFLTVNSRRKPLTSIETFKAKLEAGDEIAILVDRLVRSSGHHVAPGSGIKSVRCVTAISHCFLNDAKSMNAVWPIITEIHHDSQINDRIVSGSWYLYRMTNGMLGERRFRDRLRLLGYFVISQSINAQQAAYTAGGPRVWARGIAIAVNRNLRGTKLPVPGDTEVDG